ncbi:MAG: dihydropteroate synthase [Candidatus Thermoplasmatota archaeon]|nr:dihydropteroate synthase [Candidatus Thermoplasmatota archaeon]MBU1913695.1 dihydropteroate synthase [Candidatus Thermoplasmatota archaeon]
MGIVNCTPDSFSGDGLGSDTEKAIHRGLSMFKDGADVVDVGGESTKPGAKPVAVDVEMSRVIPVIEALGNARPGRVSVDTMKPRVAEAALFAGATVVNDVSGLRNQRLIEVVAEHDAAVIIMHMLGEPRTMQESPRYKDVVGDIIDFLGDRIDAAEKTGVSPRKIMVDPGIGFGKTLDHNLEIIARLRELKILGKPIVIGVSRKSFIGKLTGHPTDKRLEGSITAAVLAIGAGADIVRVHDVAETIRALRVAAAIASATKRT